MKRILLPIVYVLAGVVLAGALGVGAYAIAGQSLSEPARPLPRDGQRVVPDAELVVPTPKVSPSRKASAKPDAGASVDDQVGEDNSGSGSDSDNSGSGSSNSGSGSSNSGSGSGDDEPDDD